jgi:cytochrome c556
MDINEAATAKSYMICLKRLEHRMKLRSYIAALLMAGIAQSGNMRATAGEQYIPRLGDIMNNIQLRHIKLSFAGKSQNWELAAYELAQLKAGLTEAAVMYEGIPMTGVTMMTAAIKSIEDAIAARDGGRFAKRFSELTAGCNACHQSMGRSFIVIRVPTEQPFSNQVFSPQGKP